MGNNYAVDQFFTRYQSCCFARQPLQWQHRNLANWKQWTEWQLSCHVWNATGFLDSGFSGHGGPAQASTTVTAVDPVMAQMLRQQMLLTQGVMDLLYAQDLDFNNNQCSRHQQ